METNDAKKVLLILRQSPYSSSFAKSALDTALATAAFDAPLTLLFLGDGVLQLIAGQAADVIGQRNLVKQLASLPLYGVHEVFVDTDSAQRYCIDLALCPVPTKAVSESEISVLMGSHDHLLSF